MRKIMIAMLVFSIAVLLFVLWKFVFLEITHHMTLYQEYEVNSNSRKTSGTHWLIITSNEMSHNIKNSYQIDVPMIDFRKNYLLMSDGRKIVDIKYKLKSRYQWHYKFPMGIVQYDDKHYPNKVFFYLINRKYIHRETD